MSSRWSRLALRGLAVPLLAALAVLADAAGSEAQTTFRFRLQPLCNSVVLTFYGAGSSTVLGIVGYDDNCGHGPRSPIHGTAVMNPDGGFTLGYTTSLPVSVYGSTDVGLQTNVEVPANSPVGFWTDDEGETGTFVFDILDQKSG